MLLPRMAAAPPQCPGIPLPGPAEGRGMLLPRMAAAPPILKWGSKQEPRLVWGARVGLDSPHAMRSGALVALNRPTCLALTASLAPQRNCPGIPLPGPAEGRGMLLPRMADAPPILKWKWGSEQEPRLVWGARVGLDLPHAMRSGALVAVNCLTCLVPTASPTPQRNCPGILLPGPTEGPGIFPWGSWAGPLNATCCSPRTGPLAWQRNLCQDGDVESNPGPSTDVTTIPDEGAAFLRANQQAPFVTLASSSNGPAANAPRRQARKRQSTSSPNASSDSENDTSVLHHCPFAGCCKSIRQGYGGWNEKRQLLAHVATVHVAAGEIPSAAWLHSFSRWVCGHCLRLVAQGRRCMGEDCVAVRPDPHSARLPPIVPRAQQPSTVSNQPLVRSPTSSLENSNAALATIINDILACSRPLFRHVPKAAGAKWGIAWATVLQRLCREQTWEALRDWALFQKITLWAPRGGKGGKGHTAELIRSRVDRFLAGDWQNLWDDFRQGMPRPDRKKRKVDAPLSLHDKVERLCETPFLNTLRGLMEDGAFAKSVRHLLSDGVHDSADQRVRDKLRDLHPRGPELACGDPSAKAFPFPSEDSTQDKVDLQRRLRETLLSFPRAAAGGPDGLRPQHLQDIVRVDSGAASLVVGALCTFAKAALGGTLPQRAMPFLASANLIPLRKDGPEGTINVRPVAVGNTIRRFVGKFAMGTPSVAQCTALLQPNQCGVAVAGACETIACALQSLVQYSTGNDWAILQVDVQNAFNAVDRSALFAAIRSRVPELEAWARATYGCHSTLFCDGHRLTSEQGVQQGDPLGPLFFAVAWQDVVAALPPNLLLNVWYLDDGHLVGDMDTLSRAIAIIHEKATQIGVKLNIHKCRIWGPGQLSPDLQGDHFDMLRLIPQVPWNSGSGLRVLGYPVEHPSSFTFRAKEMQSIVDRLEEACHILSNLGDPHMEHILLRFCLDACRLMHFLRAIDAAALHEPLAAAARVIRRAWDDVLGHPAVTDEQWAQCTLPLRLAGLGIKDPVVLQAPARMAGILSTHKRASDLQFPAEARVIPPDFPLVASKLKELIGAQLEPLATWVANAQPSDVEEEHRRQDFWTDKVHQARKSQLQTCLPVRDRCRLRLQSMPHTTAWMQTVPHKGMGVQLGAAKYRLLLRWWLGIKVVQGDGGAPCPLCGESLDPFGDHLLCCKKNKLVQRHNAVRDALAMVFREMGIRCQTEVAIGGKTRPADVAFLGVDPAGPLAVDLVVFHPLQKSLAWEEDTSAKSMATMEGRKVTKNQPICEAAGWLFSPLSFHPWAGLGPLGSGLLNRLVKQLLGERQGWARQQMAADIWQRLSATLMSHVGEQLMLCHSVTSSANLPLVAGLQGQNNISVPATLQRGVLPVSLVDMVGWQRANQAEDGAFVGPIRIQCTRPSP
jgi:hypothetical protein